MFTAVQVGSFTLISGRNKACLNNKERVKATISKDFEKKNTLQNKEVIYKLFESIKWNKVHKFKVNFIIITINLSFK